MAIPAAFIRKAPKVMDLLIRDFNLAAMHVAAIVGNGGHESRGFTKLQEIAPTVKGSAGGYGWFQWTGPRRRSYMAWCKSEGLSPASDEANYGFLKDELEGDYKPSLRALRKETELDKAVIAFEKTYERAGVKHYPSRIKYAEAALAAWKKQHGRHQPDDPGPEPVAFEPEVEQKRKKTWITEGGSLGGLGVGVDTLSQANSVIEQVNQTKENASGLDWVWALLSSPRFMIPFAILLVIAGGVGYWQFRKRR